MSKKRKRRGTTGELHAVCVRAVEQGCGLPLTCDYCWTMLLPAVGNLAGHAKRSILEGYV